MASAPSFRLTVVSFAFLVCRANGAEVCGDSDADSCDVSLLQTTLHMKALAAQSNAPSAEGLDDLMSDLNEMLKTNFPEAGMEGNTMSAKNTAERDAYDKWALNSSFTTICETGFNAGHSALRFLKLSSAQLYEFDIGSHEYGKAAETFLTERFPGRLHLTWGDSTQTLPAFAAMKPQVQCDLIIVDGGHDLLVARADLDNFQKMASKDHLVVIDDSPCDASWCLGPTEAWTDLMKAGCLEEAKKVAMEGGGFRYGRFLPCDRWA